MAERADGAGGTLVLDNPHGASVDQLSDFREWRGSTEFGGSPGQAATARHGVVINEVLANPNPPETPREGIELFNESDIPIDIGGWFLSDSAADFAKYRVPEGTIIPAGAYFVIRESDYNPTPGDLASNAFALSGTNGDDVWLVANLANDQLQFADDIHFGPSLPGESFSRTPNGTGPLARTRPTLGQVNGNPIVASVIVSEINYAPAAPSTAALVIYPSLVPDDLEFIEIYNRSNQVLDLSGMRLDSGVEFDFDTAQDLAPNASLLVLSFNPKNPDNELRTAAFREHYGIDDAVRLVGGFSGNLSDLGDHLELTVPGRPFGVADFAVEDIAYDEASPWPDISGGNNSLHRINAQTYGGDARNWNSQAPTPGFTSFSRSLPGDFNGDGLIDLGDIDLLWAQLRSAVRDPRFDLTGDRLVNELDRNYMIERILGTTFGDTNLDRRFDSADIVQVFQVGEYEDTVEGNSTWLDGDWDADGDFTTADIVLAFQFGTYIANAKIAATRLSAAVDVVFAERTK